MVFSRFRITRKKGCDKPPFIHCVSRLYSSSTLNVLGKLPSSSGSRVKFVDQICLNTVASPLIPLAQFYKWRSKFVGMDASLIKRMKELEEENRRLKKGVAMLGMNTLKTRSSQTSRRRS